MILKTAALGILYPGGDFGCGSKQEDTEHRLIGSVYKRTSPAVCWYLESRNLGSRALIFFLSLWASLQVHGSGQSLLGLGPSIVSHQINFFSTGFSSFLQLLGFSDCFLGPKSCLFDFFFCFSNSRHFEGQPLQTRSIRGGKGCAQLPTAGSTGWSFDFRNQNALMFSFSTDCIIEGPFNNGLWYLLSWE